MIPRGAVIGVLGGGQLGRMLALAAYRLGYRVHVFAPVEGPATQVSPRHTLARYDDEQALLAFAEQVDVVTCEFENVPARAAELLASCVPVRPGVRALATCQDRWLEKGLLASLGIPTAPWKAVRDEHDVARAVQEIGGPCILKTARLGYDGKGQARLVSPDQALQAWQEIGGPSHGRGVVEGRVDFIWEGSQVMARDLDGRLSFYDLVENRHERGILRETLAPAPQSNPTLQGQARQLAARIAEELDIVGLLAVELFVMADGSLAVNELAARPHNSAHWTQDGALTCQFEQLVRAIAGLPLGESGLRCPTRMLNLLGEEILDRRRWAATPGARLHDYGKEELLPGRKTGHVNLL